MTLKEFIQTDEKINKYIFEGKLTIELASEMDLDFDIEHEKVKLIKTMKKVLESNDRILKMLDSVIEKLQ